LNPAQYLAGKRKKKAEEEATAAAAAAEAVTKGKAGNNGENQRETTEDAEVQWLYNYFGATYLYTATYVGESSFFFFCFVLLLKTGNVWPNL
jgi:hypothetical protein